MAVPEVGSGNGLHLNLSLRSNGEQAMAEADGQLTDAAKFAIAGLLHGLPDLTPLLLPTVNSYRRLRPHSFAPTAWTWGRDNRTCAIRVAGEGETLRVEIRVAGSDANAYLVAAAAIGCINAGLDAKEPPPPAVTGSAYRTCHTSPPIAASLPEAIAAMRASPTAADLLGPQAVAHYARAAELELAAHREQVTDSELDRGLIRA
jgi:glutamine synthetase